MSTTINLRDIFSAHDKALEDVPVTALWETVAELIAEVRDLAGTAEERIRGHVWVEDDEHDVLCHALANLNRACLALDDIDGC